jgi:hypothetical protein
MEKYFFSLLFVRVKKNTNFAPSLAVKRYLKEHNKRMFNINS